MGRKLTQDEVIARFNEVHGNGAYDYSKVVYVGAKDKIIIICPKHGEFLQEADAHYCKKGCAKCSVIKSHNLAKMTTEYFIEKSRKVHGDLFDYSKSNYTTGKNKIEIICRVHESFFQTPSDHYDSCGCPKCGGTVKMTSKTFIEKARVKHGDKYSYDLVDYKNSKGKVDIVCKIHGVFSQQSSSHLAGRDCPSCAKSGFNPDRKGFLYLLQSSCGKYMKIGITNNLEERTGLLIRKTPFDTTLVDSIEMSGYKARKLESTLHKLFTPAGLSGFDGYTEWFKKELDDLKVLFVL